MTIKQQPHIAAAANLYAQRQQSFIIGSLPSISIAHIERRLMAHLQLLSQSRLSQKITQEIDLFILIAANQRSLASDYLRQFPGYHAAIFAALSLVMDDNQQLVELYQQQPALRAALWQFWHEYGIAVPSPLINQAESDSNRQIRQAAIIYAADNPQCHLEFFQTYYRVLWEKNTAHVFSPVVYTAAIWGGLVRGDEDALTPCVRRLT